MPLNDQQSHFFAQNLVHNHMPSGWYVMVDQVKKNIRITENEHFIDWSKCEKHNW